MLKLSFLFSQFLVYLKFVLSSLLIRFQFVFHYKYKHFV